VWKNKLISEFELAFLRLPSSLNPQLRPPFVSMSGSQLRTGGDVSPCSPFHHSSLVFPSIFYLFCGSYLWSGFGGFGESARQRKTLLCVLVSLARAGVRSRGSKQS
jgi:hypothetical protein